MYWQVFVARTRNVNNVNVGALSDELAKSVSAFPAEIIGGFTFLHVAPAVARKNGLDFRLEETTTDMRSVHRRP